MISTAIILAGGLGTRLRSEVPDLPKCMAPVREHPFLAYVIGYLQKEGIEHFVFSLGYKSDVVIQYLDSTYPQLHKTYVVENEPLGTGGAIQLALTKIKDKVVLIVNGDTLFNVDLNEMYQRHRLKKSDCTIALKFLKNFSRYGTVVVANDHVIKKFQEKQPCEEGYINGGIYILNVNAFHSLNLQPPFSFEKEFLEIKVDELHFYGFKSNSYFIDIGVPEDYKKIKTYSLSASKKEKLQSNNYSDFSAFIDLIEGIIRFFK